MAVTWETARQRLKQIFAKVGVNRQSDLVALILTGAAAVARDFT